MIDDTNNTTSTQAVSDSGMKAPTLAEYQEYIRKGREFMQEVWDETDLCDEIYESPAEKDKIKVRRLKRIAIQVVDKIYARNPKFLVRRRKPILGKPEIDPRTKMPVIDPVTGEFAPPPDISEQFAETAAQVLDHELQEMRFKQEARACVHDAIIRPAAVMQIGYEFDDGNRRDNPYARRRSIKDFVLDPYAQVSHNNIHDCRFMAVKLKLTVEDCRRRGIDPANVPEDSVEAEKLSSTKRPQQQYDPSAVGADVSNVNKRYCVWHLWDGERRMVAYVPETGDKWPKEPEPWPWDLDAYPFHILSLDRLPDKIFGHSIIYDLQEQQIELNDVRDGIHESVMDARPATLIDSEIEKKTAENVADRKKKTLIAVDSLAARGGRNLLVPLSDPNNLGDQLQLQNVIASELNDVSGVSNNDQLQSGGGMTAREAVIIADASALATGARVDTVEDWIRDIFRGLKQIIEQTATDERIVQITGSDQAKFWVSWRGPELLNDTEVDIDVGSSKRIDSAVEQQNAINMLQSIGQVPGIDVLRLAMDVLRAFGNKHPEQYKLQQPQQMMVPPTGQGGPAEIDPATGQPVQMIPTAGSPSNILPPGELPPLPPLPGGQ